MKRIYLVKLIFIYKCKNISFVFYFHLILLDGNVIGSVSFNQLINRNEQYILLSSKEIDRDGQLESIEFTYYANNFYSSFSVS